MSTTIADPWRRSRQQAITANPSPASTSQPVQVAMWDETPPGSFTERCPGVVRRTMYMGGPDRTIPNDYPEVVRILIGGQDAGAVHPSGSGWAAQVHGLRHTPVSYHNTPADAITAVLLSSWARRLGYRAASRMYFTVGASRAVTRTGPR
jgi:hypothetical protein